MPYWLLTSTTYGSWLPGDKRGSVTSVRDRRPGEPYSPHRREHAIHGEAYEPPLDGLRRSAVRRLKSPPVLLTAIQASVVVQQFSETAEHRGWRLIAAAVMANHFHVVLGTAGAEDGRKALNDLKAYASRSLNRRFQLQSPRRWWTSGGSRRRLFDEAALAAATHYVTDRQPNPLAIWPPTPDGPSKS